MARDQQEEVRPMRDIRLLSGVQIGNWELANRVVMPPLTRSRAEADWSPSQWAAEYYGQRSGAGLVIAEATQVSPDAGGYCRTPGIWTDRQTSEWAKVVTAIKSKGSIAVLQCWHTGRIGHPDNMPEGCFPMGPSAVRPATPMYTDVAEGNVENPIPREMTEADIRHVINAYGHAAENAKKAGFDGFEIHAANGYLIEQFAAACTNQRTDAWGGTLEKRMRFLAEVIEAVAKVYDRAAIGVRLSPFGTFNDINEAEPMAMYEAMLAVVQKAGVGYIHIIRPRVSGDEDRTASDADTDVLARARGIYKGPIIAAGGFTAETAEAELMSGRADLIAFGRDHVANPDLIERLRRDLPLNAVDFDTLYTTGPVGYTDYPFAI
ncbi:MAG: alkene reductase [Amaricoccus sp.]